ncbi:MAG: histidine kinase dimerization/phospho-acceptor domain-containing protein [Thermoplasmatota archaeon]
MEADDHPNLAAALDATTRRALPAIFLGVGAFYLGTLIAAPFLLDPAPAIGVLARWFTMALAGLAGAWLLRRRLPPAGWGNALAGLLGLVTVANSLLLVDAGGPTFLIAVGVVVMAFSLFLLSLPWMVAIVALALAGWSVMAYAADWGPEWAPRTFYLAAFCVVAVVAQVMRVGLHRRLEVLKARDLQRIAQENELAREKALHEQRGRLVRMTAHELATPLTPVLLQAHVLASTDLTDDQRKTLDTMRRNLERLQATIKKVVKAAQADDETDFYEGQADHELGPSRPGPGA